MKPARLIILTVAVAAAGLAGYLAMTLSGGTTVVEMQAAEAIVKKEPTVKVLVAGANLPTGATLNDDAMRWADWPKASVGEGLITEEAHPDVKQKLAGAIIRMPMFDGEPIRFEKIADASARIMSSLLPAGKLAVATEISAHTGAGGFILPNDRVDVIMVRRGESGSYLTETILKNIRVLAIDQRIQETPDGQQTAVGSTATLELTPTQAKVVTVAQQIADRLTLALRSVADAGESDTDSANYLLSGDDGSPAIKVIKTGKVTVVDQTN
ncbi:Flp pilus assembly protein CpaB [Rhizobium sp. L1K21]|uniref:Flp pilus assembly protein CpaB n=1 Tax=Rhizobium sp. L1K21 TaxID=2954933 RepID=UPI0020938628|nr:Flp pilus assembly protein CpaB [Rhizobium sp. L1K21]MCO6187268.1 Flp pilus assembly protein CpaB [Rhizobium sp. L1K21]